MRVPFVSSFLSGIAYLDRNSDRISTGAMKATKVALTSIGLYGLYRYPQFVMGCCFGVGVSLIAFAVHSIRSKQPIVIERRTPAVEASQRRRVVAHTEGSGNSGSEQAGSE